MNALVQPYLAGTQSAVVAPLYDPRPEREYRRRFRREHIQRLVHANTLYVCNGLTPSRAWVLVRRSDFDNLNPLATNLQLHLSDSVTATPDLVLGNLSYVRADCVSRGLATDSEAIYLVELCDAQGLVYNRHFKYPTNSEYNVRAPAYPTASQTDPLGFYSPSLQFGTAVWLWNNMIADLWGQMGFALKAYPGLPAGFAVTESAEGWSFPGGSAWEALVLILEHLGLTVATDLANMTVPYTIVSYGGADAKFSGLVSKYVGLLEDDLESPGFGSGRVPGSVLVYFHRRNQYFGTEESVRRDALQWTMTPAYAVTVNATAAGFPQYAACPGVGHLWSELTVRFDTDGVPLAADVATANAVAVERVTQYYNRIYRGTAGYLRQTYTGLIPFATGSLLDGVKWHQDYAAGRLAWRTDIVRGIDPPWPEMVSEVEVE